MKRKQRPVYINLLKIKVPITAYESFTHRITGVFLMLFCPVLLYVFVLSLDSEEGFAEAKSFIDFWLVKFIFWGGLTALAFHLISGINHILRDIGFGKELMVASKMSAVVITLTALSSLLIASWLI